MAEDAQQHAYSATRRLGATADEIGGGTVQWHHSITTPGVTAVTRDTPGERFQEHGIDTPQTGVSTLTTSPQNATRLFANTPQGAPQPKTAVAAALKQVIATSDEAKKRWEFTWQHERVRR
jgi:hypothetical protein